MEKLSNNRVKNVLLTGAVWDALGGIIFIAIHGILQKPLFPEIHPFYSIVLGLFLLMLAYMQMITAKAVKRYLANIGAVVLLRTLYTFTVVIYSFVKELMPMQFFLIATIDTFLVGLLLVFVSQDKQIRFAEMFFPASD